ncbi:hypothetical protein BKA70DRAFT_1433761 [Coprinopsis sp. MPI-PUGE-AT-0042]|nr:hypothetical protein BKA70DRAFT_1433761 [Coprinopsis sp. MPI-PUGE-AT-0042]
MPCNRTTLPTGKRRLRDVASAAQAVSAAIRVRNSNTAHFLRRIQAAQVKTKTSSPSILQWISDRADVGRWAWPANPETGERIPPSELESHRRTHHFLAPCCLCAIELKETYVESRIGLVHVPSGAHGSFMNGEYVAECALRQCGYFVPLEKFYSIKALLVKRYPKRECPLPAEQVTYITDFDPELGNKLGLYQALPEDSVFNWGSRRLLRAEHPISTSTICSNFVTLWSKGLGEDAFWQLFVQCALCRQIIPRDVFSTIHSPQCCEKLRDMGAVPGNDDAEISSGDTETVTDDEQ